LQEFNLSNGFIRLIVSVEHGGRILSISPTHHKNGLYESNQDNESGWLNYGGDFLWIAPQERWGWPPIKSFDQDPWIAAISDDGLKLTSPVWEGLMLSRKINFVEIDTIKVRNTIDFSRNNQSWGLWNITQVPIDYLSVGFTLNSDIKVFDYPENIDLEKLLSNQYINIESAGDRKKILIQPKKGLDFKIGGITKELTMQIETKKFIIEKTFDKQNDDAVYPHGCNIEFYKNDVYLEAEILWPMVQLAKGEFYSADQYFKVIEK